MEELFTFNSQQLYAVAPARPSTQDNQTTRKKILSYRQAKKQQSHQQSHLQQEKTIEKGSTRTPFRRVTFNLPTPSLVLDRPATEGHPGIHDSDRSENVKLPPLPPISRRYPVRSAQESRQVHKMGMRSYSVAEKVEVEESIGGPIESKKKISSSINRQRKVMSLKMSPKIVVPISNRKLPKAFKVNLTDTPLPKPLSAHPTPIKFCQPQRESIRAVLNLSTVLGVENVEKFKKMLIQQSRLYDKLYLPRGK